MFQEDEAARRLVSQGEAGALDGEDSPAGEGVDCHIADSERERDRAQVLADLRAMLRDEEGAVLIENGEHGVHDPAIVIEHERVDDRPWRGELGRPGDDVRQKGAATRTSTCRRASAALPASSGSRPRANWTWRGMRSSGARGRKPLAAST